MATQPSLFDRIKKPTRSTSAKALTAIETGGLLSRLRLKVYKALFASGPMTAGELNRACLEDGQVTPGYHKRLSELERLGLARRVGVRACKVTGLECDEWDVTDSLPQKAARKPQRSYSVLAVGTTPEEAIRSFCATVGWRLDWTPIEVKEPTARHDWTATVKTLDEGGEFEASGYRVPGGFILSKWA
jgi:hypothetical protein